MSGTNTATGELTIGNELGLHARAAAMVVRTVSRFTSEVRLARGSTVADARSVLELLTLAAVKGCRVEVTARGPDAAEALAALERLVARDFAE